MKMTKSPPFPLISSKVTQESFISSLESIGIDRIEGYFQESHLTKKALEKYFVSQRKSFYKLDIEGFKIEICFFNGKAHRYFFNPNHSNSFFISENIPVFVGNELYKSRITRVDLNLDLSLPFEKVRKQISVKYKQQVSTHISRSGESLNLKFGKDDEVITVYKKKDNLTRIEKRLRNKKLPQDRSFLSIINWVLSKNHFENISVFSFSPTPYTLELEPIIKEIRSYTNLSEFGIGYSKKAHSPSKNFERDIKKFVNINHCNLISDSLFQLHMSKRFGITSK